MQAPNPLPEHAHRSVGEIDASGGTHPPILPTGFAGVYVRSAHKRTQAPLV